MEESKLKDTKLYIREACVENLQQCIHAEELGADRLELCSDLYNAGTTPSYGLVKKVKNICKIPVFVIIRPRGGDFIYRKDEVEIMKDDIENLCKLNIDGLVIGMLNKENEIDYENLKLLMGEAETNLNTLSAPQFTFHMAFDSIPYEKQLESLDKLVSLGFSRILCKGSSTCAMDGVENLKRLVEYAGNRIIIMPGGGVTI